MNHVTRVGTAAAIVVIAALFAGCAPIDDDGPQPSDPGPRPSAITSDSAMQPSSEPSVESSPSIGNSIPVAIDCDALVDATTIYELNPNLAIDPSYRPSSLASRALDSEGVSCGWINQTSGDVVAVSVASFDEAGLTATREAANGRGGSPTPSNFGGEGVFRTSGSVGVMELVRAPYWIVIESPMFGSATDVDFIVDAVISALP